jgi:Tol biopolymer transport system component
MSRRAIASLAILCGACGATDLGSDLPTQGPSLSVSTSWQAPVNLGPAINSNSSEVQVGIAPSGRSLYVSTNKPGTLGRTDLYVSQLQPDGSWGALVSLGPVVNSSESEFSPTVSIDGHYLYFASRRVEGFGGLDCWRSFRENPADDFGWQSPENLGASVNSSFDEADCLIRRSEEGSVKLWFTSLNRPEGQGDWDIYTSDLGADGIFGPASPVVEVNTPFRDTRMTLTGDGLEIIFSSNRPGGLGDIDLWVAERPSPNHPFCAPVNLGPTINSSADERSPSIPTTGRELYLTSNRAGGFGSDDVYLAIRDGGPGPQSCRP